MSHVTDAELRAYLLGLSSESDAARLEEAILDDDEMFEWLQGVEDDLFDEDARGLLSPGDSVRFRERPGHDRGREAFARALAARAGQRAERRAKDRVEHRAEPRAIVPRPARWTRVAIPLAIAAALAIGVGATLVRRQPREPSSTGGATQTATSSPVPRIPAVALQLTLGTARSAAAPSSVTAGRDAPIELRVRIDPADRYDRYSMELRSPAGQVVWREDNLHATGSRDEPSLVATIPSTSADAGSYELAVRGATAGGSANTLGFVAISVDRKP